MTQGIYEIVNWQDNKASTYIGSSVNIELRWGHHRSALRAGRHDNEYLQRAWDKYGENAFAFNILEGAEEDLLLTMEQEYLNDYFDRGHCYNIAITAGPAGPLSEEHRYKISESHKGKTFSKEHRRKMSEAKKGKPFSDEHKLKLIGAHKKRAPPSEETRRRMSEALMGNQNCLGRRLSEEHKRKISASMKNRAFSKEHRRKLSDASRRWWARQRELGELNSQ